jgi:hypothetical protein
MGSPLFSLILSVGTDISYGCRLSLKARLRQRWSVVIPLVCVILQVSFSYLILADLNKNVKSKKFLPTRIWEKKVRIVKKIIYILMSIHRLSTDTPMGAEGLGIFMRGSA